MANSHITYNPGSNTIGSYEPRFKSINPDSFMDIVRSTLAANAKSSRQVVSTTAGRTPQPSVGKLELGAGTNAFLNAMHETSIRRQIKEVGPEDFFKGKHRRNLSPELRKLYDQVEAQKKDSGFKSKLTGGLGWVLDKMMRFNYASAEAVSRVWEQSVNPDDTDSLVQNIGDAFADAGKGFASGFLGHDKTTFSHVLQEMADSNYGARHGIKPNEVPYGTAQLTGAGKFFKGTGGFLLDVLLDPTTYIGVGAVTKGLRVAGLTRHGVTKEVDDVVDKLVDEYGIEAPGKKFRITPEGKEPIGANELPVESRKEILRGFLDPNAVLDGKLATEAAPRSGRIRDVTKFVDSVKVTVAARETAKFRDILRAERAGDYVPVPKVETVTSGPKFMDVPASAEDLAAFHRYRRAISDNSRARQGASPARITQLDKEKADLQRKFDEYFNVSELNVEDLAKAHETAMKAPIVRSLDEQIRKARDAVRKVKNRKKVHVPTLRRVTQELDELVAKREQTIIEAMEDAALKVAPDKGTLISKLRRDSDISILRQLAASTPSDGTKHIALLRRELSYRFADRIAKDGQVSADRWLAATLKKAESVTNDGVIEDLRNLTPVSRPAKHRIKRRQLVEEEQPVKQPTKQQIAQAEAHNKRIDREIEMEAQKRGVEIAEGFEDQLLEIMVKETTPNFKRGLSFKINLPFTTLNNPNAAKVLFTLALPDAVSATLKKYVFRDTFTEGLKRWANFFKSSAGTDPLLNLMRLAYNGGAGARIEEHAKRLRNMWQHVEPAQRKAALRQWIKYGALIDENATGPYAQLVREIDDEFARLTAVFTDSFPGGDSIKASDWNKWMPEDMRFGDLHPSDAGLPVGSSEWVRASLRHLDKDIDPAELIWQMNIAREKVLIRTALKDNIRGLFGIERTADNEPLMQKLIKRGYKEVPEIGNSHLFPADVADDISKTFDLMKNQRQINELIRGFDSVMSVYKSTVTMYNPGYHARNSFGDAFMNYLAGVAGKSGLDSYKDSAKVIKAMKGLDDSSPVYQSIMTVNPHGMFQGLEHKPETKLFTMRGGRDVTAEEIWVLYNHYGLHSGFIANEFGTGFGRPGTFRATKAGQRLSNTNRRFQGFSENREDFFRLAHFIHQIRESKTKELLVAARDASESVRKYLFDYSDFTQIEKAVMLRLIPFYKWTRKAIPLMAETLFAQPGKALAYPKAMRNLSVMLGYDLGDANGVIPNSDVIIPEWVRVRGMYPIGTQSGNTVLADVAIPFNDIGRTVTSPVDSFFSMLTPAVRIPVEAQMGKRFYGGIPITSRSDYAASTIPQGSFLRQLIKANQEGEANGIVGNITDPRTLQFLSGIGLLENTDRQMRNELRNQSYDAARHAKSRNKKE